MKKTFIFVLPILIISCNLFDSDQERISDDFSEDEVVDTLTIRGYTEMEDEFYYEYNTHGDSKDPKFKSLDVVPFGRAEQMRDLLSRGREFEFPRCFDWFTGPVRVYYDTNKTKLVTRFEVDHGTIKDGEFIMYDQEGEVLIKREYKNGVCSKNIKSPYASDWKFNQEKAHLEIRDLPNGLIKTDSGLVLGISPTLDTSSHGSYSIAEKETFKNDFLVNGEKFTGRLQVFDRPTNGLLYDLGFINGKLHGLTEVYTWYGELALKETFTHGELDTILYQMSEEEMDGMAKPILCLYPEDTTEVHVHLLFDGELTHTYPKYQNGWKVTACPSGTHLLMILVSNIMHCTGREILDMIFNLTPVMSFLMKIPQSFLSNL